MECREVIFIANQNHYFYALALPESVKAKLYEMSQEWQTTLPFKTWVHELDYHITLAFLGGVKEEDLQYSIDQLQSEFDCPTFSLTIDHLGVFGKKDSPRIFWAGVNDEPNLKQVREYVYRVCLSVGFSLETRPFHPHITLARKWTSERPFTKQILEGCHSLNDEPLAFQAEKVVLYETCLGKIPKYKPITSFALRPEE